MLNKIFMKKLLAIAFIAGLLVASCAKKETAAETNTMLSEPETPTADVLPVPDSAAVIEPMAADSTLVKP